MARPPKAREKALTAYCELLRSEGERGTTVDAVAARAEISKGGVLYHFPSKEALAEAALDAFRAACERDLVIMAEAPEGPSRHYVRTSWTSGSDLDTYYVAMLRLAQSSWQPAIDALAWVHQAWLDLIRGEVGNRHAAEAIMLIGEGLYHHSAVPGEWSRGTFARSLPKLLDQVDRLKA
ncbi:TetR/AcrR family transcriptional regulator [Nocardioides sp. AE5]|uniref:TetR/AcrR family transcriptional regulator n=1 Tax=Nocardioides sp. AE5 TaxID=2962573 RepID=UPI0028817784|nr:TetR/AcrR family transcriptional regulator [Nocardioides sp. AE5]MDT0203417.1 TetR/AcrR family transcriptional regulator [Nocardioides sp. AE5]